MSNLVVSNISDGTTSVGTGYVVNGSAKAWVTHEAATTVQDSLNVSSLTDTATGKTAVNFSNSFGAKNYATSICQMRSSGSNSEYEDNGIAGNASNVNVVFTSGTSFADTNHASIISIGELA
jgi:hypothetical protein